MVRGTLPALGLCIAVSLAGCADQRQVFDVEPVSQGAASVRQNFTPVPPDPTPPQVALMVEAANAKLASLGSTVRVNEIWLFTVGAGTSPFQQLRIGGRWIGDPVYYLDVPDFTTQLNSADVEATLVNSFETWNQVNASGIRAERITPSVGNVDVFDGSAATFCLDFTAEVWGPGFSFIVPAADIVVGGWMPGSWFEQCLGSPNIIGVTILLLQGDADNDNYTDNLYVEQYYNDQFTWVLEGAQFLSSDVDLESVAVHENGHALGLGHYGGAGKVPPGLFSSGNFSMIFSPEAVMNPGYLGGEKRDLFSIDEAALRTLY
jgi:hypothetical protein